MVLPALLCLFAFLAGRRVNMGPATSGAAAGTSEAPAAFPRAVWFGIVGVALRVDGALRPHQSVQAEPDHSVARLSASSGLWPGLRGFSGAVGPAA
jgi:hypothetical protein